MDQQEARSQIIETGLVLLRTGLVARTWGNVSAKVDEKHLLITPSGLDYTKIKPENIALYNCEDGTFKGTHKPSGERGVHAVAYELLPDAAFVIHTHQSFATAFSVYGSSDLEMSEEEKALLGGIGVAAYGLPGTKKLKNAVRDCFATGVHTVLMESHGAVVAGKDRDEAMMRVQLLEEICRRNYKGHDLAESASMAFSKLGIPLRAQLDDMAQMIGKTVPVITGDKATALERYNAILVPGEGTYVKGKDEDDTEALGILVEKACVTALHLRACGVKKKLSTFDTLLMNYIYKKKYSKQKEG